MLTFNYRYRIYPDATTEQRLIEWMEICRRAYNYALREIKDWCNSRKCLIDRCSLVYEYIIPAETPFPGEVRQLNNLPKAKKEFPKLKEIASQVLQQTIKQLHKGWDYFMSRGFGFPRFKKVGQFKSLLFPQFKENPVTNLHINTSTPLGVDALASVRLRRSASAQSSRAHAEVRSVKLPKLGTIPINLHRPIPSGFTVKQVRIIRKADKWYASINIQCNVSVPDPKPHGHPIGVDVGLEKFLATSDGVVVKPPKFFRKLQNKLKLLQRRLSRKQKRSKNYEKQRLKVARLHHHIDNIRKDFHFKQAHALCDAGDMVFMEDLDYRVSAKGMLGKQMLDAGFGQFRTITQYVCWKRGNFFAVVDARGTSQECPECKGEVKKDLSVRIHDCPHCGYQTDRDVASGQVIRNRGIELISPAGLVGKETACAADLPGVGTNQNQSRQVAQPPELRQAQLPRSRRGVTRKSPK